MLILFRVFLVHCAAKYGRWCLELKVIHNWWRHTDYWLPRFVSLLSSLLNLLWHTLSLSLSTQESAAENVIHWDIKRTYVGHEYFKDDSTSGGKEALYKISKAYSVYDEEVGYCQGFSFMAAVLLLQVSKCEWESSALCGVHVVWFKLPITCRHVIICEILTSNGSVDWVCFWYIWPRIGKTIYVYTRLVVGNTCDTWLHGFAWYKSCSDFILPFVMLSLFWVTNRFWEVQQ